MAMREGNRSNIAEHRCKPVDHTPTDTKMINREFGAYYVCMLLLLLGCAPLGTSAGSQVYTNEDILVWLEQNSLGYQILKKAVNESESADASPCLSQLRELLTAAESKQLWAIKYFDAWGKFPAGLLYGHFVEFGNFDQCLRIGAKYCLANIPFDNLVPDPEYTQSLLIRLGTCLPAACSAQQLDTWLKRYLDDMFEAEPINATLVSESSCQLRNSDPFTPLDWFAVAVLSFLALLLLTSTFFEWHAQRRKSTTHPLLTAFSLSVNIRALFRVTQAKQAPHIIPCLHGIRCLSIIWIIFGHGYMMLLLSPSISALEIVDWAQTTFSMFLQSGTIAVDSFFFLSGLLLVMVTLREMNKAKGKLNVPLMYLHRYLRLTPVLALAVLLFVTLYRHTSNGPIWKEFTGSYKLCDSTWWATLLYVQNYAAAGKMCLGHSWYLAVDMQLFIISPILLISLWRWGKKAVAAIIVLTLLLLAGVFTIVMVNHLQVFSATGNLGEDSPEMRQIYYTTHARATPWFIGLLFGYYLHCRAGKRPKIPMLLVCVAWILSLAIFFAVIFAVYPKTQPGALPMTPLSGAFYLILSRVGWPLALCWVVYACINGYGELANTFLSWSFWQPLSKLSYCLYIFHILVETINIGRIKTNTHFSDYDAAEFFWSSFGTTLLFSTVMYLTIEAPMLGVDKYIFSRKSQHKPIATQSDEREGRRLSIATISGATTSQQNLLNKT